MPLPHETDGKILQQLLEETGMPIKELSRRIKRDESMLHRYKKGERRISDHIWTEIGKALRVDIASYVPRLKKFVLDSNVAKRDSEELLNRVEEVQEQYYSTAADVKFIKEQMAHYDTILRAKDVLIDQQQDIIANLRQEITRMEAEIKKRG